ncbi:MAG: YqhA family protein [Candidatus Tectimicrobiota bacterium]
MKWLEQLFEWALWHSRLLVLSGVIAGVLLAIGAFYMAAVDVVHLLAKLSGYANPGLDPIARAALRSTLVTYLIKAVDNYLIAAILLLFALGLYELFISRMDAAGRRQLMPQRLQVHNLDDLKDRIAKLILLVLVIEFFQHALELSYTTPIDLLYLAIGVLLISGAFYLSSHKEAQAKHDPTPHGTTLEEKAARPKRLSR